MPKQSNPDDERRGTIAAPARRAAMRNDARPIGAHAPASPVGGDEAPIPSERHDSRNSVAHDRQSHIVNREAEQRQPSEPGDSTTPSSDATLNTKI
jgi:hypothetical protein